MCWVSGSGQVLKVDNPASAVHVKSTRPDMTSASAGTSQMACCRVGSDGLDTLQAGAPKPPPTHTCCARYQLASTRSAALALTSSGWWARSARPLDSEGTTLPSSSTSQQMT